jgi:hypothetical protein
MENTLRYLYPHQPVNASGGNNGYFCLESEQTSA